MINQRRAAFRTMYRAWDRASGNVYGEWRSFLECLDALDRMEPRPKDVTITEVRRAIR